jgi:hypothetical protein
MTGFADSGLHEVNRPEWGGVIDEHFNLALTLVAVIPRAYWTLVHSDGATAHDRPSRAYGLRAKIPTMPSRHDKVDRLRDVVRVCLLDISPQGSTGRFAQEVWDLGPIGLRLRRDYSHRYEEAKKHPSGAPGTRPFLPRRTLGQGVRPCLKFVFPVFLCRRFSRS